MDENANLIKPVGCKSCGFQHESPSLYCSNCGGRFIKERLTVKSVLLEFFQNIFNVDSKFFTTLKDLLLQPEVVFTAFVSGGRKRYFHPVSFLAIAIVLNALVSNYYVLDNVSFDSDIQSKSFELGYKSAGGSDEALEERLNDEEVQKKLEQTKQANLEAQQKIQEFIKNNSNLVAYISIPFYAVIAFLVFWRRKVYNFAEMVTIVVYQNGFTTFVSFALILLLSLVNVDADQLVLLTTLIVFLYSNYSFQRLFKLNAKELVLANLRFLLILISLFIVTVVIFSVITVAVIQISKAF
jgi:hypothetical protein